MSRARRYPPANITAQWWEDNFTRGTMLTIDKLLLHTTETTSWPSYDAGAKAPTATYNPWVPAAQRWRQHNWLNTSARALQDPTSTPVRENRDGVVQVEIIAYCNPASYAKYGHGVNALPDSAYEDLGAFLAFLHTEWSVPLVRAPKWETYPPSNDIRMSSATYDAFKGVLGHQHASGNTHGDPGMTNAQVDRILNVARRITGSATPAPVTKPVQEDDMPYTPEQIQTLAYNANKQYGADLWAAPSGTGTHFIADTKAGLAALTAQVAGLTAAVKTLAEKQNVDPQAIIAAVQSATEQAMSDLKITLSVDDTPGA